MALKGLFLGLLGRKEDGYENIRGGIKLCLKSPVCWHVYGLLCRADKNYDEAAKCYRNALRFDKDNGQILRDLAVLQLQMRQYSALCDTRYQLLTLRPVVKVNWINLAVAYHLSGKHEQAIGVLNAVLDAFPLESNFRANQLEQSELIFYKASILEESGKLQEAYDSLDSKLFAHPDVPTWYCRRAALLCAMERFNEAAPIYKLLLEYNPDCRIALQGHLQCSAKIDQKKSVYETISELQKAFPRSVLLKTELVNASDEKSLKNNLIDVILPLARRGILSAFSIIRRLYREEGLASILDDFCSELQQEILRNNKADYVAWIHLLLAQHYSFRPGEFKKAIEHMESAASLEPATPEVFLYYAKILRRLGHANEAAECMNFARQLDLSDRFLNSKTAKYMLKAGRIDEAKKLAGMFLKKSDTEDPLKDLVDMQVLWFAHEMGLAQQSFGDHVKAMTYFNQIRKHFEDFYEDQFDFHNYVLRRMTLCRYVKYSWF
jgi:peptide alpha-N-acetyltransferase